MRTSFLFIAILAGILLAAQEAAVAFTVNNKCCEPGFETGRPKYSSTNCEYVICFGMGQSKCGLTGALSEWVDATCTTEETYDCNPSVMTVTVGIYNCVYPPSSNCSLPGQEPGRYCLTERDGEEQIQAVQCPDPHTAPYCPN